jgi:hypothetical protein
MDVAISGWYDSMMRIVAVWVGALLLAGVARAGTAPPRDPVGRARQLYNEGRWDEAIEAANDASQLPPFADAAAVVLARAHMERFRAQADPADLTAGREALKSVRVAALPPRARLDFLIGLGESLYLDDQFGPAAELFEDVLSRADEIGPTAHDRVLDWWASAADRQAQQRVRTDRPAAYRRVVERLERELERKPGSAPAAYWVAASLRAAGDLDRAWDAAIAAWVRAPLTLDRAQSLRADIDRLVQQAIIPERVRQAGNAARELEFRTAWEEIKTKWK